MYTIDPVAAGVGLAAILIANIGAAVAAYVSIRVELAVHKTILQGFERDINELAAAVRGDGKIRSPKII